MVKEQSPHPHKPTVRAAIVTAHHFKVPWDDIGKLLQISSETARKTYDRARRRGGGSKKLLDLLQHLEDPPR